MGGKYYLYHDWADTISRSCADYILCNRINTFLNAGMRPRPRRRLPRPRRVQWRKHTLVSARGAAVRRPKRDGDGVDVLQHAPVSDA